MRVNENTKLSIAMILGMIGCLCYGGGDWLMLYGSPAHEGIPYWLTEGVIEIAPWRNNLAMALAFPGILCYGAALFYLQNYIKCRVIRSFILDCHAERGVHASGFSLLVFSPDSRQNEICQGDGVYQCACDLWSAGSVQIRLAGIGIQNRIYQWLDEREYDFVFCDYMDSGENHRIPRRTIESCG